MLGLRRVGSEARTGRPVRRATVLALCAALVSACGAVDGPSPIPSVGGTAVAPTPPATPVPTGPREPCASTAGSDCDLEAADYVSTEFGGGVSFTLAETWQNTDNANDLIAMYLDRESGQEWLEIVGGPVKIGEEENDRKPALTVEELAAFLPTLDGIEVSPLDAREIGGLDAKALEVANTQGLLHSVFYYAEDPTGGQYFLGPGVTMRIYWVEVDGRPVLVTVESPTPRFPTFLEAIAEPFLASIEL